MESSFSPLALFFLSLDGFIKFRIKKKASWNALQDLTNLLLSMWYYSVNVFLLTKRAADIIELIKDFVMATETNSKGTHSVAAAVESLMMITQIGVQLLRMLANRKIVRLIQNSFEIEESYSLHSSSNSSIGIMKPNTFFLDNVVTCIYVSLNIALTFNMLSLYIDGNVGTTDAMVVPLWLAQQMSLIYVLHSLFCKLADTLTFNMALLRRVSQGANNKLTKAWVVAKSKILIKNVSVFFLSLINFHLY